MKKCFIKVSIIIFFVFSFNFITYPKSINELNNEKNSIKDKIKDSKKSLEESKTEKSSILKEVEYLDKELEKTESELEKLKISIEETNKILEKTENELKEANEKKEKQYESLKKRIKIMYENRDSGYIQILLDSKGFTEFLKRIEYINHIIEHDKSIFERYRETEEFIYLKVEQIKAEKKNIEDLTNQTNDKKAQIEKNISNKHQIVAKIRSKEETLDQQIKDLEKEDREITRLINEAKAIKVTKASNNKIYTGGSGGILAHPVPQYAGKPYNDVFGYRKNPISGKRELHSGLDLKATYGCDIVAAESGTIMYSGNRGGYGKTIIIDHGNGMTTLYAHNSKLVVSKGEEVKRGQVIAKAGSTGYSTGVHAHFEVRINGKVTDPSQYLR